MTVGLSSEQARDGLRAVSPALVLLARVGYAAKGVVYIIIGVLAARVAIGSGGRTTDSSGALDTIATGPFGSVALAVVAIGLLGYMLWRIVAAVTDAEGKGNEPTKLVVRAAQAGRGLLYGALAVEALRLMKGSGGSEGSAARDWSARLLELPFGRALVGAVGLGVIGYAAYQVYRAAKEEKVRRHLDLAEAGPERASWIVRLGRFGIAARAVVFALMGVFLVRAATQSDASEAGGIAQSLRALASADAGQLALGVVAFGLVAYGVYELATARYRHMRAIR
jgi:hypothetical protein